MGRAWCHSSSASSHLFLGQTDSVPDTTPGKGAGEGSLLSGWCLWPVRKVMCKVRSLDGCLLVVLHPTDIKSYITAIIVGCLPIFEDQFKTLFKTF